MHTDPSQDLLVERSGADGAIATLVLNRPDSHNAIRLGMYEALPTVLGEIGEDPSVKVLVVRGAERKAFASGADISEFREVRANAATARSYNERVAGAERALESLPKPTIAMVHGYCIGGGCGLALACDFRFADENGPGSPSRLRSSGWSTAWSPPSVWSTLSVRRRPSGRAGPALVLAAVASFVAGTIGAILISLTAPRSPPWRPTSARPSSSWSSSRVF